MMNKSDVMVVSKHAEVNMIDEWYEQYEVPKHLSDMFVPPDPN